MRTFRPWNSSIPQPLTSVESFAILARDGRVIPVETAVPEDGAHLAEFLSRSVARRLAVQGAR